MFIEVIIMDVITKICTKCSQTKLLNDFNNQKKGKNGKRATCRLCQNAENKLYKSTDIAKEKRNEWKKSEAGKACEKRYRDNPTNKEKYMEYVRTDEYKKRHRESADRQRFGGNRIKALERDGHKCVYCNGTELLQVHHLDEMGRNKPKDKMNNELSNLTTLCAKCHIEQHNPVLKRWENRVAK